MHPTYTHWFTNVNRPVMKSVNQVWWMQADSHSTQDNINRRHVEIHNYGRTFIVHGYQSGIDSKRHCFVVVSADGRWEVDLLFRVGVSLCMCDNGASFSVNTVDTNMVNTKMTGNILPFDFRCNQSLYNIELVLSRSMST